MQPQKNRATMGAFMAKTVRLPIYLDYQATTPVDPQVLQTMLPYFSERFGNAASKSHEFGWIGEAAVEHARGQIAELLGAHESEIIFTSGATESINLALKGVADAYRDKGKHLITSQIEHKAGLDTCRYLEERGFRVTYLKPDSHGRISAEQVTAAIEKDTLLISIMAANNEIGTLNPIAEIGRVAKAKGVLFHSDATQAVGKVPVRVDDWGVDLVSLSGHKIYGPKGIGALYCRRKNPRVTMTPLMHGGGHEKGYRSGTLNVPAIVGFGKAAELAALALTQDIPRIRALRDELQKGILAELDGVRVNGHPEHRIAENLSLSFERLDSQSLIMSLRELAVSAGSACTSGNPDPSHVLRAIGLSDELARNTIRISLGRTTSEAEVKYAMSKIIEKVREFRQFLSTGE